MGDRETGSEWSHILGEAKAGPLAGRKLTVIPSSMTNWGAWHTLYPDTSVTLIERSARRFQTGMLGNLQRFGIGLTRNGHARLWRFDRLQEQPLVNEKFEDLALVIYFDVESRTPSTWNRRVLGRVLTFESRGEVVVDRETESTWDLRRGRATAGELAGTVLTATQAIVTFRSAWKRFHPETTVWTPQDDTS